MSFYRDRHSLGGAGGIAASSTMLSPHHLNQHQPNYFLSPTSPITQQQQQPSSSFHQSFQSPPPQSPPSFFDHHHQQHPQLSQHPQPRKSESFEPMNTSPIANNPQQLHMHHQQPQYLPSFLTGDHMPSAHHNINLATGEPSIIFEAPQLNKTSTNLPSSSTSQPRPGGPPISGLGELSGISNSAASFEQSLAAVGATASAGGNPGINLTNIGTGGRGLENQSPINPTTPISGNWVTIFGFPSSAATYVLTNFSQYGTIIETKVNPGSNWLRVRYSNKIEARRALNRNGAVIGGTMMIGVLPYENSEDQETNPISTASNIMTSRDNPNVSHLNLSRPSSSASSMKENQIPPSLREVKSRIRPLARSSNQTYMNNSALLPKENSGLVTRALEYVFGW